MNKKQLRLRKRIRSKISGTSERPRVHTYRSSKYLFVQAIDDNKGVTLASVHGKVVAKGTKTEKSIEMGKIFAEKLKENKISTIVFDRGVRRFHGRIKAFAESLREGGIKF